MVKLAETFRQDSHCHTLEYGASKILPLDGPTDISGRYRHLNGVLQVDLVQLFSCGLASKRLRNFGS